jgi:large subunit ribosomal protein L21
VPVELKVFTAGPYGGRTNNLEKMYAIVDLDGRQYRVKEGQQVYIHRLEGEEGSPVVFDKVMMIDEDGKVNFGQPVIEGASVSATILSHLKGDKVLVFRKKRRKGYQKLNGHRQYLSQVRIDQISAKGAKKIAVAEAAPVVEPVVQEPAGESAE